MNETPSSVGYIQPQQQNSINSGNKERGWKDEETFYRRHYHWNCYIGWEHYKHNNITYFSKYCNTYMYWKPVKTTYAISRSLFFTRVCMSGIESDFDSGDFLLMRSMCNFFSGVIFLGGPVRLVQSTNNLRNHPKITHFIHFSRNSFLSRIFKSGLW